MDWNEPDNWKEAKEEYPELGIILQGEGVILQYKNRKIGVWLKNDKLQGFVAIDVAVNMLRMYEHEKIMGRLK